GIRREVVGLRADGSTFPMELSVAEVKHGGDHVFVGIVMDITDRKRAQEELIEREARLRSILDTAADAIILIDETGIVETISASVSRLFGYRPEDRKSTRLNSSHVKISYAVFCLK